MATEQLELVRKVVNHFKHSGKSYQQLHTLQRNNKKPEKGLSLDVKVRWNSTLAMVSSAVEQKDCLIAWSSTNRNEAARAVNAIRWPFLQDLTTLLEPIRQATVDLEAERKPTLGLVWPLVAELLSTLAESAERVREEDNQPVVVETAGIESGAFEDYLSGRGFDDAAASALDPEDSMAGRTTHDEREAILSLAQDLHDGLKRRWEKARTAHCWMYASATVLDPSWKAWRFSREVLRDLLIKGAEWVSSRDPAGAGSHGVPADQSGAEPHEPPQKQACTLLQRARLNMPKPAARSTTADLRGTIVQEVDSYLSSPGPGVEESALDWWKYHEEMYPHLSCLARYVLSIPATSASCERDFSTSGYMVSERRCRLKPALVSGMMLLHGNADLISLVEEDADEGGRNEEEDELTAEETVPADAGTSNEQEPVRPLDTE